MNSNELIHRYFLGIATAEDVRELADRLHNEIETQDEFLLHAELDAHLRQAAQCTTTGDEQSPLTQRPSSPNLWKWLSGISTLAATILLGLFAFSFPLQKSALAYPSLGDFEVKMSSAVHDIWTAAGTGDLATIQQELRKNVPVDSRMSDGLTPLHLAAVFNRRDAVEMLLSERADVSLADDEGNTALHMAAFLGHTEIVHVLLTAGADPAMRNNLGFSVTDLVEVIWSPGLEHYYRQVEKTLSTALDLEGIRTERHEIVKLLLAANIAATDGTPSISIWQAAMTGNTAAVKQHMAVSTDLNAKEDFGGSSPLILAAIFGQFDVAKLLIDVGVDLEIRNHSGGTALHQAAFFCRAEIVRLLLQSGANPESKNNENLTPLEIVSSDWNSELECVYRYVYGALNLPRDIDEIKQTRSRIAEIIRENALLPPERDTNDPDIQNGKRRE